MSGGPVKRLLAAALHVRLTSAALCPNGTEAPWACHSGTAVGNCVAGRPADPCRCLDGYCPVGKEGWSPSTGRGYEFTCCLGDADNGYTSCGEDLYVGILSVFLLIFGFVGVCASTLTIRYTKGLEPLTSEDLSIAEGRMLESDGARLHRTVEKHLWCVTLEDLRQFRRLIRHAVANGVIKPTDQDPFDISDNRIGPSMYTVNMQYIKPVTALAGNPSWALMLHPGGLKCDLFITHAWAEGVFEFVDQIINSWPFGARAAYVCFLSNPQNLDIGEMIQSPEESPFAKALQSASQVLAAPNHKHSIYTRAWCTFEAYLAYTWGKSIYTATSPPPNFWPRSLRVASWSLVTLGVFFCVLMHGNRKWALWSPEQIAFVAYAFGVVTAMSALCFACLMSTGRHHKTSLLGHRSGSLCLQCVCCRLPGNEHLPDIFPEATLLRAFLHGSVLFLGHGVRSSAWHRSCETSQAAETGLHWEDSRCHHNEPRHYLMLVAGEVSMLGNSTHARRRTHTHTDAGRRRRQIVEILCEPLCFLEPVPFTPGP